MALVYFGSGDPDHLNVDFGKHSVSFFVRTGRLLMLRPVNFHNERCPERRTDEKVNPSSGWTVIAKRSGQRIQGSLGNEPPRSPRTQILGNPFPNELTFVAGFQPDLIVALKVWARQPQALTGQVLKYIRLQPHADITWER